MNRTRRQRPHSLHLSREARRALLLSLPSGVSPTCYLWRNFASTGQRADEYEIYLPIAPGRYAVHSFQNYVASSGGCLYWGRYKEGVPVVNLVAASGAVTRVGAWAASANAAAYNGTSQQSSTAGDTLTGTVTGHTLILRCFSTSNGGFGTVAIDGDFTAANMLPAVTQTEVTAGFFAAGDIGKRYIECYSASAFEDMHFPLAEGLPDAAHTIQVRIQGTKRAASTGTRCYIAALAAATAGTLVTDANASMGYVRDITNLGSANAMSQVTTAPEYAPGVSVNYQYMGGNHGNETLVSQEFRVDNVVSAPANGVYVSGTEIKSILVSTMTHPDTGATIVCNKTGTFTGTAGDMSYVSTMTWQNAGHARNSYYGMMHMGRRPLPVSVLENNNFPSFLVGDSYFPALTADSDAGFGLCHADLCTAFSPYHDTVALVYIPHPDQNTQNFIRMAAGAFVQDRVDFTNKFYFSRSSANAIETISVNDVHLSETHWRLRRIPFAARVLGF